MIIKPIAEVYASLVIRGLKTEDQIIDSTIREAARVVICSKKIYDVRDLTFAAACGVGEDATDPAYKDDPYVGFCKFDDYREAVIEYCTKKGYGSLVKTIVAE